MAQSRYTGLIVACDYTAASVNANHQRIGLKLFITGRFLFLPGLHHQDFIRKTALFLLS